MKNLLFLSLILIAFSSCSKEDETIEQPVGILPKYMIAERSINGSIEKDTAAIYYNRNKIGSIVTGDVKSVFEYTGNTLTIKEFFKEDVLPRFYSVFEYNALGKIIRHANYEHTNSDFTTTTYVPEVTYIYEYNTDGTVKLNAYYGNQTKISEYNLLTYDLKGNIVNSKSYWVNNGTSVLTYQADYTYDNQSHYFKNAMFPNSFVSNVNNITKEVSIQYTYDSNNVLISSNTKQTDYTIEYNNDGFPSIINNGRTITRFFY